MVSTASRTVGHSVLLAGLAETGFSPAKHYFLFLIGGLHKATRRMISLRVRIGILRDFEVIISFRRVKLVF